MKEIKIVIDTLEGIQEQNMDLYDLTAVLVSDLHETLQAKTPSQFRKQKADLKRTLKVLKRQIDNQTFKGLKHYKVP